jgi:hypothetical protein
VPLARLFGSPIRLKELLVKRDRSLIDGIAGTSDRQFQAKTALQKRVERPTRNSNPCPQRPKCPSRFRQKLDELRAQSKSRVDEVR